MAIANPNKEYLTCIRAHTTYQMQVDRTRISAASVLWS